MTDPQSSYLERLFGLQGRTAVVTGAAGQLGGQYVRALLSAGARVAAWDIAPENPKGRLQEIREERFLSQAVDIRRKAEVSAALDEVVARLGRPEILVNNAALDAPPNADGQATGPFETYPESAWAQTLDVNLTATGVTP